MSSPSPNNNQPLDEKISAFLLKIIKPVGITVGTAGAFWQIFVAGDTDWVKAIGSTVIGLASSYAAHLLTPVHKGNQRRLEKAGKALNKAVDTRIENRPATERKYLEALQAHCHKLELEGLTSELPSLALKDVFVPLRLDSVHVDSFSSNPAKSIWDFLPKHNQSDHQIPPYRCIAIVAEPGYGKTTLTRHLALNYATRHHQDRGVSSLLPILLRFRSIYTQIDANSKNPSLPTLIQAQVYKDLPRLYSQDQEKISPEWFERRLQDGRCLVMLDGLDEVPEEQRQLVGQWANWQMQAYPSQFLITSRPHGYQNIPLQGVTKIQILDFNRKQKEDFIDKWYRAVFWHQEWYPLWHKSSGETDGHNLTKEQAEAQSDADASKASESLKWQIFNSPELEDLAKNPLLITIIAVTYRNHGALPKRRVALYRKMFNLLLEDRPNRRSATALTLTTADENLFLLRKLALQLARDNKLEFTIKDVENLLKKWLEYKFPEEGLTPQKFLHEIQTIAGLLVGHEDASYAFSHKTFQEYLAASELERRGDNNPAKHKEAVCFLSQKIKESNWKAWEEIIRFYVSMTKQADLFVTLILKLQNKGALLLAYQIIFEDRNTIKRNLEKNFYEALETSNLGIEKIAPARLKQKCEKLISIQNPKIVSISNYVSPIEYQLLLAAQQSGQFPSTANLEHAGYRSSGNLKISWSDALWFCAWLSSKSHLYRIGGSQDTDKIYDYRLPTPTELMLLSSQFPDSSRGPQPWTTVPNIEGQALRFVRTEIPSHYQKLVDPLSTGNWKKADRITDQIMLTIMERTSAGYSTKETLKAFPREDLTIIDQLWLKYSGGKFGFMRQKEIWLENDGKLEPDIQDEKLIATNYKRFSNGNGWRPKSKWLNYEELVFSLKAPIGHLPSLYNVCRLSPGFPGNAWLGWYIILSKINQYSE